MATSKFRLALNQARVPFVSKFLGRPVLVPQLDNAGRQPKAWIGADDNLDVNTPCVVYLENAVPVSHGYKSVGYVQASAPTVNEDFDQCFPLRDAEENQVLYSPAKGQNYIYDAAAGMWTSDPLTLMWAAETIPTYLSTSSENTPATAKVTRAYVDGNTFICYSRLALTDTDGAATKTDEGSIYRYDPTTVTLTREDVDEVGSKIQNLGIPIGEIDGISSSNGYLLIWTNISVYWAPFDGTEFDFQIYANGAITGAGNQIPEDIKGPITAIVPVAGGFIIFTNKNAVGASYNSNNRASPWIFREIPNAGGVQDFEQVSVEGTLGAIYAYTSGGLQRISLNNAENVHPACTDFLGGRLLERYDFGTHTLSQSVTTTEFFVKLTYIGSRFLVISYGTYPGVYSFALIYDAALERWGKLRIVHVDAFFYTFGVEAADLTYGMLADVSYEDMADIAYDGATIESSGVTLPRQAVAFLLKTGEVKLATLDYRNKEDTDTSEACVILGRLQLSRSSLMTVQEVEVEGFTEGSAFLVPSLDGRTLGTTVELYLREETDDFKEYGCLEVAKNFNLIIEGEFNLSSVIFEAQPDGDN